jgi:pyrimidine operon attenuation protein/uracil phosphoribosyltransferase
MAIMSNHHHCLVDNHVLTGRVTRAALGDCADYFAR